MYDKSINKIDEIINNEKQFSKYIEEIQNNNEIKIPSDLNNKILKKLNIDSKYDNINNGEKVIKLKKIEILKVACFSLLAVIAWNVMLTINNNSFDYKKYINEEKEKNKRIEQVKLNVDNITGKITTLFMMPTLGNERSNIL